MKNKILKVGMCALLAASFLTGCAEESTQTDVDLNSMTIEEITEKAKEDGKTNISIKYLYIKVKQKSSCF